MSESRRPLKTRSARWAQALALWAAHRGLRPNTISVASMVFAAIAGGAFVAMGQTDVVSDWVWLLLAAAGIQLRLLCNMLDGMVAMEAKLQSKTGEIYNELPDRIADVAILVGAGYAQVLAPWTPLLGWGAAVAAMLTAYVRAIGVVAGGGQQFCGPMAKPHRMFALTVACLLAIGFDLGGAAIPTLPWALGLILLGSLVTSARRTCRVLSELDR